LLTKHDAIRIARSLEDQGISLYYVHPNEHTHRFYEPGRIEITQEGEEVTPVHTFCSADSVEMCLSLKLQEFL
jgi:predicted nuclease with RNAse H fold